MKTSQWMKPVVTVLVLCAVVACFGMAGARYLSRRSQCIANHTLPALVHLGLANQFRGQAFQNLVSILYDTDEAEMRQDIQDVRDFSNKSQKELDQLEQSHMVAHHRQIFDEVMAEREHYLQSREKIIELVEAGRKSEATKEMVTILLPIYERYLNSSQKLVEQLNNEGIAKAESITTISVWVQVFAILSSIVIFFFGFFLGYTR